jgi:alkanesulfonate monooxygenase
MSALRLHWALPTSGDSRGMVAPAFTDVATAQPTFDSLAAAARIAEELGFDGVHTPIGTWRDEGWLTIAALIGETERLGFLVSFRPETTDPVHAAQLAALYQRISKGRLSLHVEASGPAAAFHRADEFLSVMRGAWTEAPFDFHGEHYQVEAAQLRHGIDPLPDVYVGGWSGPADQVAAHHADACLIAGQPEQVAEQVERIRGLAAERGRSLRFGLWAFTLSRDTSEQAWYDARRLLDRRRDGGGAGTALVGSHEEVADLVEEYHRLGIDELILSGHPHIDEAYSFGQGVMPVLARRGLLAGPSTGRRSSPGPPDPPDAVAHRRLRLSTRGA